MHNSVTPDFDEIAKNVNQIGYYKIKKFLDDKYVSKIINLFPRNVIKKGEEVRIKIPTNFFAFFIKLIKFQFKLIYIGIYLVKLKKKLKCDEIMKRVQSSNCRLVSIDIMFNPKVDKPVKDWHADQLHNFYGKDKGNYKFFIYLTPTSSNNGCLAYVNQSNNLSNTIANLMSIGELPKEIIYTLKQYSNFISKEDIKKKILNSKKPYNIDLDKVINNVNKVNSNPATNELDISMENAGDCLLFDETGMHRGAQTKQDRYVLRFIYQNINN